jgi:hypothetical protein
MTLEHTEPDQHRRAEILSQIQTILLNLYGEALGSECYRYVQEALARFESRPDGALGEPYSHLDGRVFAICYPDNVYNDSDPTLQTLAKTLGEFYPDIGGIHILPERTMSHSDVWPQDLFGTMSPDSALDLVGHLTRNGVIRDDRTVAETYRRLSEAEFEQILAEWYEGRGEEITDNFGDLLRSVRDMLNSRSNSHFSDGGFSQITRKEVDRRFGTTDDLRELSSKYALMLDYVVNHLDIDNEILDAYRRRENDGTAFVIIPPDRYEDLKERGVLERTFRPRPFPLFTGLRRYPLETALSWSDRATRMNQLFETSGLSPLDSRVVGIFTLYFKVQNDQGLSAEDRRIFDAFLEFASDGAVDLSHLFADSRIQTDQKVLIPPANRSLGSFCAFLGIDPRYAEVFESEDDRLYGEKFFVYTTFSESQVDVNPASESGFRLIIADLFSLLESGDLAMMRMDAIKYLWKEIGKKNFDMDEGNQLIDVIRMIITVASPRTLPLDEVNSPDPVVYEMGKSGGFSYLFGQVNTVPAALNSGSLKPIELLYATMDALCPDDLVLFVTLSSHDGRSVQGLGVDRSDGHVSIGAFADLKTVIESRGGRAKHRAVAKGRVPSDTFAKVCREGGLGTDLLDSIFREEDDYVLIDETVGREGFVESLAHASGRRLEELKHHPAIEFLADWVIEGQTPYELCCTSRSAFLAATPEEEARRLALAQIFILSFCQTVPAIYFNDLLGLENDLTGFGATGKPRDLNRKKSRLEEIRGRLVSDPFAVRYRHLLNRAIRARATDRSYYPGSRDFEYRSIGDTVFLNHAFARGSHALVVGNILPTGQEVEIDMEALSGMDRDPGAFKDTLGTDRYAVADGRIRVSLRPYGAVWLNPAK